MADASVTAQAGNTGIGFRGLLTILFIGLKLGHVIGWSWWWVLAPLWLPYAVIFGVVIVCAVVAAICMVAAAGIDALIAHKRKSKK